MGSLRAHGGRLCNQPPGVSGRPLLVLKSCRAGYSCYRAWDFLAASGRRSCRSTWRAGSLRYRPAIRGTNALGDWLDSNLGSGLAPRNIPSCDLVGGNHYRGVSSNGWTLGDRTPLEIYQAQEGSQPMLIVMLIASFLAGFACCRYGLIRLLIERTRISFKKGDSFT